MKIKKFLLPSVLLAAMLVAMLVSTLIFGSTTRPLVEKGEFPFSISYEYKGADGAYEGIYVCEFDSSANLLSNHERYWEGYIKGQEDTPDYEGGHIVEETDTTVLAIHAHMQPGFFMGDPLYIDYYEDYGTDGPYPHIEYYDYENEISLEEGNSDEILESLGFFITEVNYPSPIENSFTSHGIKIDSDIAFVWLYVAIIFLVLCIIFVRKDKDYTFTYLDKSARIVNIIIMVVALPFISLITAFSEIVGGHALTNHIGYTVPAVLTVCIAASIVLRRKGFSKSGFFIQFAGVALFVLNLVLEYIMLMFIL